MGDNIIHIGGELQSWVDITDIVDGNTEWLTSREDIIRYFQNRIEYYFRIYFKIQDDNVPEIGFTWRQREALSWLGLFSEESNDRMLSEGLEKLWIHISLTELFHPSFNIEQLDLDLERYIHNHIMDEVRMTSTWELVFEWTIDSGITIKKWNTVLNIEDILTLELQERTKKRIHTSLKEKRLEYCKRWIRSSAEEIVTQEKPIVELDINSPTELKAFLHNLLFVAVDEYFTGYIDTSMQETDIEHQVISLLRKSIQNSQASWWSLIDMTPQRYASELIRKIVSMSLKDLLFLWELLDGIISFLNTNIISDPKIVMEENADFLLSSINTDNLSISYEDVLWNKELHAKIEARLSYIKKVLVDFLENGSQADVLNFSVFQKT